MHHYAPNSGDSIAMRLSVSLPLLLLLALTHLTEWAKKVFMDLLLGGLCWLTLNFFILTHTAQYQTTWIVGIFVTVSACAGAMQSLESLRTYCIASVIMAFVFGYAGRFNPTARLLGPCVFTVLIATYLAMAGKLQALRKLESSAKKFQNLFSSTFEGVAIHKAGVVLDINESLASMLGYSESEVINHSVWEFFNPKDRAKYKHDWQGMIQRPHIVRLVKKDGTEIPVEALTKSFAFEGEMVLFTAIQDISERLKNERTIADQQTKMMTASKMSALGQMAGGVAHEINNPLAIIQGHARLLSQRSIRGELTPEIIQEVTTKIDATVMRIAKIIQSLRMIARDVENAPLTTVPLSKIISDTLDLCTERFRRHGVTLEFSPISDALEIDCRPHEIGQSLLNLINNSFDAVENQVEKWVKISASESSERPNHVLISVIDSGPGFSPQHQERFMEPFFTTKPVGKGTGLGFSLSKGLVEGHNGSLWIDFAARPTRVVIELPRSKASSTSLTE